MTNQLPSIDRVLSNHSVNTQSTHLNKIRKKKWPFMSVTLKFKSNCKKRGEKKPFFSALMPFILTQFGFYEVLLAWNSRHIREFRLLQKHFYKGMCWLRKYPHDSKTTNQSSKKKKSIDSIKTSNRLFAVMKIKLLFDRTFTFESIILMSINTVLSLTRPRSPCWTELLIVKLFQQEAQTKTTTTGQAKISTLTLCSSHQV